MFNQLHNCGRYLTKIEEYFCEHTIQTCCSYSLEVPLLKDKMKVLISNASVLMQWLHYLLSNTVLYETQHEVSDQVQHRPAGCTAIEDC